MIILLVDLTGVGKYLSARTAFEGIFKAIKILKTRKLKSEYLNNEMPEMRQSTGWG
jgi:hypothetical protein